MDKLLISTIGLPQSGKSSWSIKQNIPIVNPDSIRLALYGQPFIKEAETMVWVIAKYMVKSLFIAGHYKIILDATNTTPERRLEWVNDLWKNKYIYFNTSIENCIERAYNNNKDFLVPIIYDMAKKLDISNISNLEYFKEK